MAILSESSRIRSGNTEVSIYKLLDDAATIQTSSTAVDVLDASSLTLLVESSSGTSSGVVTLEGARISDYSGTWASLATATIDAASKTFIAQIALGDVPGIPIPYVRARISKVIGGGTVDVYLIVRRE